METSNGGGGPGLEGDGFNDHKGQCTMNNFFGPVENCNFGENRGEIIQHKQPGATPHEPLTFSGSRHGIYALLNPIPNASHTRDLKTAPPNSQCFPGTRQSVMKDIRDWANSSVILGNNPHVMWIYGFAGCGKSAIAQEAARYFDTKGRLAAAFFFFRGSGDRSKVIRFANTIAHQVAAVIPATIPFIEAALKADPNLATHHTSLSAQFERLVYAPISNVNLWDYLAASLRDGPFIIVLDGLDECEDHSDIATFIDNMIEYFSKKPRTPLRFLITSRVESHIHQRLYSSEHVWLLDLVDHTSDADIAAALDSAFEKEKHSRLLAYAKDWPSREEKAMLVKHIGRSYIFMTTVLRLLFDPNLTDGLTPMERLPLVLSQKPNFDSLYKAILLPWEHLPHFLDIISTIALAMEPLSIVQIAELIKIRPVNVVNVLINLHAIFQIPGDDNAPVTVWHTSLRDFLCTEDRSGSLYAESRHHLQLAYRDLNVQFPLGPASSRYIRRFAIEHIEKFLEELNKPEQIKCASQFIGPIFNNGQTTFEVASQKGKWTVVHTLLKAGVDVNIRFKALQDHIICALHAACHLDNIEMVYFLLESGANPNIVDIGSEGIRLGKFTDGTALAFAAGKGDVKLATRLLECGADPNLQGGFYGTALGGACSKGSLEVIELLLEHGADLNLGYSYSSPLHACAWYGHGDCARALLMRKAGLNVQDENGNTPLHLACFKGYDKVAECLLEFKADTSIKNNKGRTALQLAQINYNWHVAVALQRHRICE